MLSLTRATGEAVRIVEPGKPPVYMLVTTMTRRYVRVEFWHREAVDPFEVYRLEFGDCIEIGGTVIRLSEFEGFDRGHVRFDFDAPREIVIDRVEGSEIRG